MTVDEMDAVLKRAYLRIERFSEDAGTHEEMYEGYQYAFDLVVDVAEQAVDMLRVLEKKDS